MSVDLHLDIAERSVLENFDQNTIVAVDLHQIQVVTVDVNPAKTISHREVLYDFIVTQGGDDATTETLNIEHRSLDVGYLLPLDNPVISTFFTNVPTTGFFDVHTRDNHNGTFVYDLFWSFQGTGSATLQLFFVTVSEPPGEFDLVLPSGFILIGTKTVLRTVNKREVFDYFILFSVNA